jgi:hypothetical protein
MEFRLFGGVHGDQGHRGGGQDRAGVALGPSCTHDPRDRHTDALDRLFRYYLDTTAVAMRTLHPDDQLWHNIPHPATSTSSITDLATAAAWFDTERANLTAIIADTADTAVHGSHTHTTRLAYMLLFRCVMLGDSYPDSLTIYANALHAAHFTGDRTTEAYTLTHIGIGHWQQGCYAQAIDHHERAIGIFRAIGNRTDLGVPDADIARTDLAALEQP